VIFFTTYVRRDRMCVSCLNVQSTARTSCSCCMTFERGVACDFGFLLVQLASRQLNSYPSSINGWSPWHESESMSDRKSLFPQDPVFHTLCSSTAHRWTFSTTYL